MKPRRPVEEMSMSFLDVICCGFGAVILLLMTTKFIPPMVLEQSPTHLDGTVAARQEALFQIRGQTDEADARTVGRQRELDTDLQSLAQLEREMSTRARPLSDVEERSRRSGDHREESRAARNSR